MSLLQVTDLKVNFGGIEALKGISFQVEQGQVVTLIGANGAGKSTTLRAISSLVNVSGGSIFYEGRDIKMCIRDRMWSIQRRSTAPSRATRSNSRMSMPASPIIFSRSS